LLRFLSWFFSLIFIAVIVGCLSAAGIFYYYGAGLPDFKQLASYEPPVVTRLYSSDGRLFAEYAYEKRIYVPISEIPDLIKNAFLSAEDKNFYYHFGIDVPSVIHAALKNLSHLGSSKRPLGASTITQQVAKNFLLSDISHSVSLERKIKEAILSLRIEKAYSKDYIFELYLNEVYLGAGAHGVAAAALNYFNKSMGELTISEAAFLAALPKAPSRYHPEKSKELTLARRNWVLDRMLEDGHLTQEQDDKARAEPITLHKRDPSKVVESSYFAEEVRRDLLRILGEKSLYQNGYVVRTTLDPELQKITEETLREGLINYDRKHGWRGSLMNIALDPHERTNAMWVEKLKSVIKPAGSGSWEVAIVLEVSPDRVSIGLLNGQVGTISFNELRWARRYITPDALGPVIVHPKQVLVVGDVVLVSPVNPFSVGKGKVKAEGSQKYQLNQIPAVSGAIVVLEPHTGRVLAMQGGYSFEMSQYNRATQAMRQTGSAFKIFDYLAALEAGLTPSSIIYDTPFSISMGWGLGIWAPHNWDNKYMGPITMRRSFELSRNASTVRMIHERVGMKRLVKLVKRFNINPNMPMQLSTVLGSCETTVLRMAAAAAMIANGGKLVIPSFFDHVQDRRGKAVLVNTYTICEGGALSNPDSLPMLKDLRPQVTDPVVAYQLTSLLRGAVERGTGKVLRELDQPVAVKSGTTNDFKDAWMVGISPTLAAVVYIGKDKPETLGDKQFGGVVAGPILRDLFRRIFANQSPVPFKVPPGVKQVRVNSRSGLRTSASDPGAIWEAFRAGTEASGSAPVGSFDKPVAKPVLKDYDKQFETRGVAATEQWRPVSQPIDHDKQVEAEDAAPDQWQPTSEDEDSSGVDTGPLY
jgi:penicillin-binding protein 1A